MFTNNDVLNQLPNDVVRSAIIEIIDKNIPCKDYALQIENGSAKGDNYIGIVYRLSAVYKTIDQYGMSKSNKFGLFVKVAPDSPIRRNEFFAKPCFLRECFIYDEYLPLLVKFQESKGIIPTVNGFNEFVKCYKTLTEDMKEGVLMEDLNLRGFVMNSRFGQPSVDVVKLVMKTLGKLHAISFALKDQWPNQFAKFTKLKEIFAFKCDENLFVKYLNSQEKLAYGALSRLGDEKYLERVKTFFQRKPFYDHILFLLDGPRAEPYAAVCHGDCWNNNILFKFINGNPSDIRLLDWQFTRYASPVCDLMYYIFCCTTKVMRDEYYKEFIDEYYRELSSFLRRLGSDPTVLFPRTAVDDQLNRFGAFALLIGLMAIPTIMIKEEDVPDLDEISAKLETGDDNFTRKEIEQNLLLSGERIRDVIIDLIQLKYI